MMQHADSSLQVEYALLLAVSVLEGGGSFEEVTIDPDGTAHIRRPRAGQGQRAPLTWEQEEELRFTLDLCRELSWRRCVELIGQ